MKQWEKEIFNRYLMGLTVTTPLNERQTKKLLSMFFKESAREAKQDGSYNLPLNHGDILLQQEKDGSKELTMEREEGATDQDIIWWYNLHEIERRLLDKIDIYHRTAMYMQYNSEGLSEKEAVNKLFKFRPKWGNPKDTRDSSGGDRPLPPTLMDRTNKYIIKRSESDSEGFKRDCLNSSSLNALIRREIKEGNL